jgi:hypothetical protein
MHEIETLILQPVEIEVGGETITIKPVTMRNLQPAIKAALPIIRALKSGDLDIEALKSLDVVAWVAAYAEYGDALLEMVSYMTGIAHDDLMACAPDEVILAASAAIRANLDFFASLARRTRAAPMTEQVKTGQKPSSV